MNIEKLTHDEIADLAAKKLSSMGYVAFSNVNSAMAGERPDAMGIKSCGEVFLVESKISRSDFIADQKKPFRKSDSRAIGNYRAYITPRGLLSLDEVPYGWQLWEINGKNKPVVKVIKGQVIERVKNPITGSINKIKKLQNCDDAEYRHFVDRCCYKSVAGLMSTIFSRIENDGIDINKYANRGGNGFLRK